MEKHMRLGKGSAGWYQEANSLQDNRLENSELVMRGRKLVLNYTDGSPCDSTSSRRARNLDGLSSREIIDGDDDDDDDDKKKHDDDKKTPSSRGRRKNIIISMLCERDPLAQHFALAFVASPDECSYFFEGRTNAACATANTSSKTSLNPSGVFSVILIITLIVYLVGGCVYNRAVLQQRGWQQIPNYNLWAGIFGFFRVRRVMTWF